MIVTFISDANKLFHLHSDKIVNSIPLVDESSTEISHLRMSIYIYSGFRMFRAEGHNQGKLTTDIRIYKNYNM